MPELPEVETIKKELENVLIGQTIQTSVICFDKTIKPLSKKQFKIKTEKQKITNLERRSKIIFINLSNKYDLAIHLKMTGQLIYKPRKGKLITGGHPQPGGENNLPNKFTRLIFNLSEGTLYFNDMRKFGWIKLIDKLEKENINNKLGIEPLTKDFDLKKFKSILNKHPNKKIKTFLLDQTLITGLGNIYVDEACFLSNILPTREIKSLTQTEIKNLHLNIKKVLRLSISKKGTSAKNYIRSNGLPGGFVPYLNVYGRSKLKCKKCPQYIEKIKFQGRGTHFCPNCQH